MCKSMNWFQYDRYHRHEWVKWLWQANNMFGLFSWKKAIENPLMFSILSSPIVISKKEDGLKLRFHVSSKRFYNNLS